MRAALALLVFAIAARAGEPTPAQLTAALTRAVTAWGTPANVAGIGAAPLNACAPGEAAAFTDLVLRTITVNSACRWDRRYLDVIVTHEVGHLLIGQGHSQNRHSVMFAAPVRAPRYLFLDQPGIRRADRALALDARRRERPTILRGAE